MIDVDPLLDQCFEPALRLLVLFGCQALHVQQRSLFNQEVDLIGLVVDNGYRFTRMGSDFVTQVISPFCSRASILPQTTLRQDNWPMPFVSSYDVVAYRVMAWRRRITW